ncbi:MAG: hypothetical protein BWX58_00925 [Deltaproteobacteria bacterium ADurb.Bin026]|nr:MAG: hypothetical protein BWX58_00925 [Deltaproteobacteria bacterium ADurb.Bin026]
MSYFADASVVMLAPNAGASSLSTLTDKEARFAESSSKMSIASSASCSDVFHIFMTWSSTPATSISPVASSGLARLTVKDLSSASIFLEDLPTLGTLKLSGGMVAHEQRDRRQNKRKYFFRK